MTWNVIQDALGNYQLLDSTLDIPEGWTLVVITCNPEYLTYLSSIEE